MDWTFQKASFLGAPFFVETSSVPGGRRVVVHEYAGSEPHDVEDMGRKAGEFTVSCYFCSDASIVEAAGFIAMLDGASRIGLLMLPFWGARMVQAIRWDPSWTQQKLNFASVNVTFVEISAGAAASAPGAGVSQLRASARSLPGILGQFLSAGLAVAPASVFAVQDALSFVGDMLEGAYALADLVVAPSSDLAGVYTELNGLSRALGDPAAVLLGLPVLSGLPAAAFDQTGSCVDPGALAAALMVQIDALADAASNPAATAEILIVAAGERVTRALAARASVWTQPAGAAVAVAEAILTTAEAIRLLAVAPYASRLAAVTARTRMAALARALDPLRDALDEASLTAFDQLWGLAARQVSNTLASLAPVLLVETNRPMPSATLAWRLYADPERGADLATRNNAATPLLMPVRLEAPAS